VLLLLGSDHHTELFTGTRVVAVFVIRFRTKFSITISMGKCVRSLGGARELTSSGASFAIANSWDGSRAVVCSAHHHPHSKAGARQSGICPQVRHAVLQSRSHRNLLPTSTAFCTDGKSSTGFSAGSVMVLRGEEMALPPRRLATTLAIRSVRTIFPVVPGSSAARPTVTSIGYS